MKLLRTNYSILVLGLTLFAFLLRVYRLEAQSYWIDEALTIFYANLSLPELGRSLQTVRAVPPLYHVLTIYWVNLLGDGEYALRFFSLLFSVMAVPLTYRLGQTLGGARLGIVAALLLAAAPYQVWHAQDARNYSMLTAASAMSMWAFVRLWRPGNRRWWLLYILSTEWAVMTHYHGLIVIGIQGLFLLFTWRRHWRNYLAWGGSLVVILLPYAAWMLFGSSLWQSAHWLPKVGLGDSYLRSAVAYSVGELVPPPQSVRLTLVFVLFYGLGLVYAVYCKRWGAWRGREMFAFLAAYTLAPNLAAWVYSELQTPVYLERYLIPVQVGYLLAVAVGILAVVESIQSRPRPGINTRPTKTKPWRAGYSAKRLVNVARWFTTERGVAGGKKARSPFWAKLAWPVGGVILLGLSGINGWVLYHHYTDPVYAKPDWRQVVRTIEHFSLPGDAILLTGDGGERLFDYYYRGDLPVYFSFNTPVPPPDEARQRMAAIAADHRRLWYTPYGVEIDAALESWLLENAYPAWHSWLGRKRLALYGLGLPPTDRRETLNRPFLDAQGQGPTLVEAALPAGPTSAGDLLPLNLTWLTPAPLERDYRLSLRLVNARGDIFAQSDWPSLAAGGGVTSWPANRPVSDRRSLWIPVDVPPGDYALQLVVYSSASGQGVGRPVVIPNVALAPAAISPPPDALSLPNRLARTLDGLTLVGYAGPDKIQPGQEMWLWLYWQAQKSLQPGTSLRLGLSSQGETVTADFPLAESVGPLDSWQPGQVRRAVYHLPTSPRLSGPRGQLELALISSGGEVMATTLLTQVELDVRPRQFSAPAVAQPLTIAFGAPPRLTLLGYNLPAADFSAADVLSLTLYWQAEAEMTINYTVFVQVLNQTGQVVAQVDQPPQAGAAPTTTWLPGEILIDPYTISLAGLPPGDYRLITGLYNPATGERLPVAGGGDFVELGMITVRQ